MKNNLTINEEKRMEKNNFRRLLGIQIEEITEGNAVITLPYNENLLQALGLIHGGVLSVLIDSVTGSAIRTTLPEDTFGVTVEMNINYIRPAMEGKLIAKGKVVHTGKSLAVGVGEIFAENGKLLATGRATYAIVDRSKNKK